MKARPAEIQTKCRTLMIGILAIVTVLGLSRRPWPRRRLPWTSSWE